MTKFFRLVAILSLTIFGSCASSRLATFQPIDHRSATDYQILDIKGAEIRALGMGYTGAGNRPDNTARIDITGKPRVGTVTRFVLFFYPVGDSRLIKPFYNSTRTTLTITQTLPALPGWISCLTAIPTNGGTVVHYYAVEDRYEFGCLRTLTRK